MPDIFFNDASQDKVCRLLDDYYCFTYRNILRKRGPLLETLKVYCRSITGQKCPPLPNIPFIFNGKDRRNLDEYARNVAPGQKICEIEEFSRIGSLLDFGCGYGNILLHMKMRYENIVRAVGVEIDDAARGIMVSQTRMPAYADVGPLLKQQAIFDAVMIVHVFHHMSDNNIRAQLNFISRLLADDGFIYLVEDYLGELDEAVSSVYDRQYDRLTDSERRLLLALNDYWANVMINGRDKSFQLFNFKTYTEWEKLLGEEGFTIRLMIKKGFNQRRLHGVPSISFVAVKKQRNIEIATAIRERPTIIS